LSDQFLEGAGDNTRNWHVVSNGWTNAPDQVAWGQFGSKFESKFGRAPTQFAGNAFDLTNLVLDAIAGGAGRDRAKVRDWVRAVHGYSGVTGEISFDEAGDVQGGTMSGYDVVEGKYVLRHTLQLPP